MSTKQLDKPRPAESLALADSFRWSATRIGRLMQCARHFRYQYVDRIPAPVAAPTAFGRALHGAIRFAHERHIESGAFPSVDEILEAFDADWRVALDAQPVFKECHPGPGRYTATGHDMVRAFHKARKDAPPPLAVDVPFEMEMGIVWRGETCFTTVTGTIDRIDEIHSPEGETGVGTTCYKATRAGSPGGDTANDLEMTVYTIASQQLTGQTVLRTALYHLADGKETNVPRDADHIEWFVTKILPFAYGALRTGMFPPAPDKWCAWCDFKERCNAEGFPEGTLPLAIGGLDGTTR